ncbi:hypothetical protein N356_gp096 [Cellulophaga phage phi14:2]|uniref:Uncharacterized protein n=1 Tax=Cellulophaga phage phi14:2 TaxID=1327990 RepID=S0A430_9CAUD|nr:hypothetical protein N356_gp096 [Cellulophaga phage phi14:2]AGO48988.1 hypothetical protein Phi14:2_gp110 [Cellulophaga phage phi14:2]
MQVLKIGENDRNLTMTYLPAIIESKDIKAISPLMSKKGIKYKHVSVIETYNNDVYTVHENYLSLQERRSSFKIKGFKNEK